MTIEMTSPSGSGLRSAISELEDNAKDEVQGSSTAAKAKAVMAAVPGLTADTLKFIDELAMAAVMQHDLDDTKQLQIVSTARSLLTARLSPLLLGQFRYDQFATVPYQAAKKAIEKAVGDATVPILDACGKGNLSSSPTPNTTYACNDVGNATHLAKTAFIVQELANNHANRNDLSIAKKRVDGSTWKQIAHTYRIGYDEVRRFYKRALACLAEILIRR
jgi:hypothetical protein